MAILLGLAAGITYGVADFAGGIASRRTSVFQVTFVSQVFGSLFFAALLLTSLDVSATPEALIYGFAAGAIGAVGVTLLYGGLARGRMSVVAPITAVEAAAIPVIFGVATGDRPSALAAGGVVVALVAVLLVSSSGGPLPLEKRQAVRGGWMREPGLREALGAGAAFGAFFILLGRAGEEAGLWPLVGARVASLLVLGLIVLVKRVNLRPPPGTGGVIALAGLGDVAANLLYLLATREGLLSLVAVLTSLYPASTVVLARVILKERMRRLQAFGLSLAAAGVVLMSLG